MINGKECYYVANNILTKMKFYKIATYMCSYLDAYKYCILKFSGIAKVGHTGAQALPT